MITTLFVLVVVALLVAAAAIVVAGVVAARFGRLSRSFQSVKEVLRAERQATAQLDQAAAGMRREINRGALRVAKLEALAGVAPESVHIDMRGPRPADKLEREPTPLRVPRLGDLVEALPADAGDDFFIGEVSVVDHVRRFVSVTAKGGAVQNFPWERLNFVA